MSHNTNQIMIKSQNRISQQEWGEHAGCKVYFFRLENSSGAYVEFTNYGATLVSAVVPDKAGNLENVILGYHSLPDYIADECYLGATIGRFANRIGGAEFTLDGTVYHLDANDGNNSNHGGNTGFNTRVFDYQITESGVSFGLLSKDGDGGYPGDLKLVVTYEWTDDNELKIKYQATADKQTVASFTNHAYFNLSAGECAIFDHTLKVYAENMLDVDATYVPTGLVKPAGKRVLNGEVLREKMIAGGDTINGYNHCFVLQNDAQHTLKTAALLIDSTSGRRVEVATSYPSIVVYTGDYLQSKIPGNYSRSYRPFDGLCLECQHYPDSPNHAHFPSATLGPGEAFHQVIVYKFGVVA